METALHRKSLQEQLNKLDELIAAQMEQVERTEAEEQDGYAMPTTMQDLQARKRQIREALGQLEQADTAHLHRKEPEARVMKSRQGQTLAYNAQAVVDHDSDLIVAAEVCNDETDHAQLIPMLDSTQQTAGQVAEQTVADTGYYGGEPIAEAQKRKLPVIVRMQDESGTKGEFNKSHFRYDAGRDGYVCPRGELLQHEATHAPTTGKAYPMQVYRCRNRECPAQSQCTTDPKGRSIKRTPYEGALSLQAEKQKNWAMQQLLSLRKEIVEHIFGLLKAIDGFRRFTVRGLEGARTQWALACTALNLRKLWRFHTQRRLRLQAA
jgi:transposase